MPCGFDMNYSTGLSNTQRTYDFTVLQHAGSLSLVHNLGQARILYTYQLLYSTVLLIRRHETGLPQPNLIVCVGEIHNMIFLIICYYSTLGYITCVRVHFLTVIGRNSITNKCFFIPCYVGVIEM